MSSAAALLAVAAAQIGYQEGAHNQSKYGAWYGMDYQPWCMMFVSWCAAEAGISTQIIPKMAYVPYCAAFYQSRGAYYSAEEHVPQAGDLIFYGSFSHVGIVEKVQQDRVFTIEGNTTASGNSSNGHGVYRRSRLLHDTWITGYARPAYEEEEMQITTIRIRLEDFNREVEVQGFVQDGTSYIRLRDAQRLFPLTVGCDATQRIATVKQNFTQEEGGCHGNL